MPPAKKLRSGTASKGKASTTRPLTAAKDGGSEFAQLAKQHWLKSTKRKPKTKVKNDVLKRDIWDVLEKDDFAFKSLLTLESLQILEKYDMLFFFFPARQPANRVDVKLPMARIYRGLVRPPYPANCPDPECQEAGAPRPVDHIQRPTRRVFLLVPTHSHAELG